MKKYLVFGALVLLLVFRLWLAINAKHGDMYNNQDWGKGAVTYGLSVFYELPKEAWPHSRPNQPPGSILLHAASYLIDSRTNSLINYLNDKIQLFPSRLVWWWPWNGNLITIKLPSIIADFAIFFALASFGRKGRFVGFVYLLNPALWYNSAWWGQTDSVVAAFAIWGIVLLIKKHYVLSPLILGLSFITKASWLPILPLYLFYWFKTSPKNIYYSALIGLSALLVALPFHFSLDLPVWLFHLYTGRILGGETATITVIAFNFWNLIFAPDHIPDTVRFLGFPANLVGWVLVLTGLLVIFVRLARNSSPQKFISLSALLFFTVFLFAPRMLQRYYYPVFPLLSLYLIYTKRIRYWFLYGITSAAYLVNMYYLWWAPGNLYWESFYTLEFTKLISIIYLCAYTWLLFA